MKAKRTVMIMCLIVGIQIQASAVDYKKDNLKISRSITDSILYKILLQLDLNENDLNKDLCVIKPLPQHEKFSVCVIPKFSKAEVGQYDKDYYELDAYILVVESNTGKIVSKFLNRRPGYLRRFGCFPALILIPFHIF